MGTGKDALASPDFKVMGVNGVQVEDSSLIFVDSFQPFQEGRQIATPTTVKPFSVVLASIFSSKAATDEFGHKQQL